MQQQASEANPAEVAPLFPLSRVKLENFRALREIDLEALDPYLNVFIGSNASGKTTMLDAIAAGLAAIQDELLGSKVVDQLVIPRIDRTVIQISAKESRQEEFLRLQYWGQPEVSLPPSNHPTEDPPLAKDALRWSIERSSTGTRGPRHGLAQDSPLSAPLQAVKKVLSRREPGALPIPVFAYYGVKRAISAEVLTQEAKHAEDLQDGAWLLSRAAAYDGALDATAGYKALVSWWRSKQTEEDERQKEKGDFSVRLPDLEAVRIAVEQAVRVAADGGMHCTNPRTKAGRPGLMVDFDRGEGGPLVPFELAQLSDGFRTHLALVMDLARRMVQANPPPDGNIHAEGWGTRSRAVVLIDEIDLHLHPGWQRYVLSGLRAAFPSAQFIVTTHSPQVLATVSRQHVKLLSKCRLITNLYVEGRDTNGILEEIFGIAARPAATQQELRKLFQQLDDENFEEARQHLETLESQLGPHDEAVVRAHWLLDMENPEKVGRATPGGE